MITRLESQPETTYGDAYLIKIICLVSGYHKDAHICKYIYITAGVPTSKTTQRITYNSNRTIVL